MENGLKGRLSVMARNGLVAPKEGSDEAIYDLNERRAYMARRVSEGAPLDVIALDVKREWPYLTRYGPKLVENELRTAADAGPSPLVQMYSDEMALRSSLGAASPAAAARILTQAMGVRDKMRTVAGMASAMSDSQPINPVLDGKTFDYYIEQREFLDGGGKHKIAICGRRTGKTLMCARVAAEYLRNGMRVLYTAPTSAQTNEFWRHLKHFCRMEDGGTWAHFRDAPKKVATNPNPPMRKDGMRMDGKKDPWGEVRAESTWDGDGLRGGWADLVIMDEAAFQEESVRTEVVEPMLGDTGGSVWIMTTPPSASSLAEFGSDRTSDPDWIRRWWDACAGLKDEHGNSLWTRVRIPTLKNPFLEEGWADAKKAEMLARGEELTWRIEYEGELIEMTPGALWSPSDIRRGSLGDSVGEIRGKLDYVVIGVDPSGGASEVGIVVCGRDYDDGYWVLEDRSFKPERGSEWKAEILDAWRTWGADLVLAEKNFGGQMVDDAFEDMPEIEVAVESSANSKYNRAQPVAMRYQASPPEVRHMGEFPELESQMTRWLPGSRRSPDRMDAMVFALSELMGLRTEPDRAGEFGVVQTVKAL